MRLFVTIVLAIAGWLTFCMFIATKVGLGWLIGLLIGVGVPVIFVLLILFIFHLLVE